MIACTVSGNLTADAQVAFENKNSAFGKTYKIRLASNKTTYKNGAYTDETTWVSGLMSDKKIGKALEYLKKGKGVICTSSQASVSSYIDKSGQAQSSLELGYIDRLELTGGGKGSEKKQEFASQKQYANPQEAMKANTPDGLDLPL